MHVYVTRLRSHNPPPEELDDAEKVISLKCSDTFKQRSPPSSWSSEGAVGSDYPKQSAAVYFNPAPPPLMLISIFLRHVVVKKRLHLKE